MKRFYCIFAALFGLTLATSCDDGRIEEVAPKDEEGIVCTADGLLTGVLDAWPEGYTLALAGFSPQDEYAVISKAIAPYVTKEGALQIEMAGIPSNVEQVEVCVLNRLRQRVATFSTNRLDGIRDTLRLHLGTMDVSPVNAIQTNLLNASCIACHGASGFKGAGLDLTAGRFYEAVVRQPSQKVEGKNIVEPGDADGSVLSLVLRSDISASWRQNHADMLNRERTANLLQFVDKWIDGLE
ncbi:MAG: hypothetical protein IJ659_07910 [Alloprevotella sp.]|nr:hypothetical protein [Alloprevotella sp.]